MSSALASPWCAGDAGRGGTLLLLAGPPLLSSLEGERGKRESGEEGETEHTHTHTSDQASPFKLKPPSRSLPPDPLVRQPSVGLSTCHGSYSHHSLAPFALLAPLKSSSVDEGGIPPLPCWVKRLRVVRGGAGWVLYARACRGASACGEKAVPPCLFMPSLAWLRRLPPLIKSRRRRAERR